ncbi:hypothetical protein CFP65_1837 [Kitasatospora sp. MMS16-BH015]|uniref:hypothetical protein n=1 Tax=Kitasatospora sp. MMS16-BH015 TaxID=2018025 RepID=UPI000CA0D02D|nr:hypothetical protein [Kitasatospora sp. MMS16-BH015]AUG76711.1 hypothetical protein CFP65_1837 [Kitasatospora sp. MMS16-BH015]
MAGASFQIDLDEVESAAKLIRSMLDDLEEPTNHLEAVVKQVKPTVYGADLLGDALVGKTSALGGVGDHQQQVLEGIRTFLTTSGIVAANLLKMAQSHRDTDDQNSQDLHKILRDGGTPPVGGQVTPPVPAPAPTPAPAPAPAPTDPGYVAPKAPTLDYNHPVPPVERPPAGGGGGPHRSEI